MVIIEFSLLLLNLLRLSPMRSDDVISPQAQVDVLTSAEDEINEQLHSCAAQDVHIGDMFTLPVKEKAFIDLFTSWRLRVIFKNSESCFGLLRYHVSKISMSYYFGSWQKKITCGNDFTFLQKKEEFKTLLFYVIIIIISFLSSCIFKNKQKI